MCIILDECVLLMVLCVQMALGVPVFLITNYMGIIYMISLFLSFLLSLLLAFVGTLEKCCCQWVSCMYRVGICVFYMMQLQVIGFSAYGVFFFTRPYLTKESFIHHCQWRHLDNNLINMGCTKLQSYYMATVLTVTTEVFVTIYLMRVGGRIHKKHVMEANRLAKQDHHTEEYSRV